MRAERRVDQRTARRQDLVGINEDKRMGRGRKSSKDVFRCGSNDERRGEWLKTRGEEKRKRRRGKAACIIHPR